MILFLSFFTLSVQATNNCDSITKLVRDYIENAKNPWAMPLKPGATDPADELLTKIRYSGLRPEEADRTLIKSVGNMDAVSQKISPKLRAEVAAAYEREGSRYQRALDAEKEAVQRTGKKPKFPIIETTPANNFRFAGDSYLSVGNVAKAAENFEKAARSFEKAQNFESAVRHFSLANKIDEVGRLAKTLNGSSKMEFATILRSEAAAAAKARDEFRLRGYARGAWKLYKETPGDEAASYLREIQSTYGRFLEGLK